ncbi:hypothetical protein KY285_028675 [Solanum tuberosum]|nr:hypothetical protein KY285_028675 [Solanum tuberosum]
MSPYKGRNLSMRFMVTLLSLALYTPSVFAYNVALRNVLRAKQWQLAYGLFDEMRQRALSPDRLKTSGITPDLVAYNTMINVFGKAKLFREAQLLIKEMRSVGVLPDTVSYSTLLTMYVENQKFLEALSVFSEMNEVKCSLDLTTCNIMIDVYGQLDMAKEADRLFWSMRKMELNQMLSATILF